MRASQFTEEQIIGMLQEAGVKTADVCGQHDISAATFQKFNAKLGRHDVSNARHLKAQENENAKLRKLLAEQILDNAILQDTTAKKCVMPDTKWSAPPGADRLLGDVIEGLEYHRIDRLDLECLHESLRLGVVVGVSAPAHRADQVMGRQEFLIDARRVLRSAVGMMNASWPRAPSLYGHLQCREREPIVADLEIWMRQQRTLLSSGNDTAKAINYLLNRWAAFTQPSGGGRLVMRG